MRPLLAVGFALTAVFLAIGAVFAYALTDPMLFFLSSRPAVILWVGIFVYDQVKKSRALPPDPELEARLGD